MKYIQAPTNYEPTQNEKTLFLAGGITGTINWQSKLVEIIQDEDITIINPRQKQYKENKEDAKQQITWEHGYLKKVAAISFWFTEETLCPICLYELGTWSNSEKPLFVGINPNYKRKLDVEIQTKLARPEIEIVYSLNDLAKQIKEWAK